MDNQNDEWMQYAEPNCRTELFALFVGNDMGCPKLFGYLLSSHPGHRRKSADILDLEITTAPRSVNMNIPSVIPLGFLL